MQIWDFHSGQLRGQEESSALEAAYTASDGEFITKTFGELIRESSTKESKMFQDIYENEMNIAYDDMASYNVNPLTALLTPPVHFSTLSSGVQLLSLNID